MLDLISTKGLFICRLNQLDNIESNKFTTIKYFSRESLYVIVKKIDSIYYEDIFTKTIYKDCEHASNINEYYVRQIIPLIYYSQFIRISTLENILNNYNNNDKKLTKKLVDR